MNFIFFLFGEEKSVQTFIKSKIEGEFKGKRTRVIFFDLFFFLSLATVLIPPHFFLFLPFYFALSAKSERFSNFFCPHLIFLSHFHSNNFSFLYVSFFTLCVFVFDDYMVVALCGWWWCLSIVVLFAVVVVCTRHVDFVTCKKTTKATVPRTPRQTDGLTVKNPKKYQFLENTKYWKNKSRHLASN